MTWKQRYCEAHLEYYKREFVHVVASGFYCSPLLPSVATANGLTKALLNYLTWQGHNATRISVTGRKIGDKWIKGTTRRGRADIDSTILIKPGWGRPVKWEIKAGKDRPSEYQLAEQVRERKAGGEYYFVHDMDEFFLLYDGLFVS